MCSNIRIYNNDDDVEEEAEEEVEGWGRWRKRRIIMRALRETYLVMVDFFNDWAVGSANMTMGVFHMTLWGGGYNFLRSVIFLIFQNHQNTGDL